MNGRIENEARFRDSVFKSAVASAAFFSLF